jgi:hypothetical protein
MAGVGGAHVARAELRRHLARLALKHQAAAISKETGGGTNKRKKDERAEASSDFRWYAFFHSATAYRAARPAAREMAIKSADLTAPSAVLLRHPPNSRRPTHSMRTVPITVANASDANQQMRPKCASICILTPSPRPPEQSTSRTPFNHRL